MDAVLGQLVSIAESWPLQLTVLAADGRSWAVTLGDAATVTAQGAPSNPAALRPGQQVDLRGSLLGPQALSAVSINLL